MAKLDKTQKMHIARLSRVPGNTVRRIADKLHLPVGQVGYYAHRYRQAAPVNGGKEDPAPTPVARKPRARPHAPASPANARETLIHQIVTGLDAALAGRQAKIEAFKAMLSDPDIASVVAQVLGDGAAPQAAARTGPRQRGPRAGTLRHAILGLAGRIPAQFTQADVLKQLRAANFHFRGSHPDGAVRDALYRLKDRGVRLVKPGSALNPNVYEFATTR